MDVELKPCPFCGGKARQHLSVLSWVECENCGNKTQQYQFDNQSIDAWNRRSAPKNKPIATAIEQANELVRALIRKSEPSPCEWCDAQNCETCNLNTENDDDECKFSLAVDAVEPENKPLTLEQE